MTIQLIDPPNLSGLTFGIPTLYVLEGLGFSKDGKQLLVQATFTDSEAPSDLRYGIWIYDIASHSYLASVNQLIATASDVPLTAIDVQQAVLSGFDKQLTITGIWTQSGNTESHLFQSNFIVGTGGTGNATTVSDIFQANPWLGGGISLPVKKTLESDNHRFIAIQTDSPQLAPESYPDANDVSDIYLIDMLLHQVQRVSVMSGLEASVPVTLQDLRVDDHSVQIAFSTEAVFVKKELDKNATNPDPSVEGAANDIYVWRSNYDSTGLTGTAAFQLVSSSTTGIAAGQVNDTNSVQITDRGLFFSSAAGNITASDVNGTTDAFLHLTNQTTATGIHLQGNDALTAGSTFVSASASGETVLLLSHDPLFSLNGEADQLVLVNAITGEWQRVSGANPADDSIIAAKMSADGHQVVFSTAATNLVTDPLPSYYNLFLATDAVPNPNSPVSGHVVITGNLRIGQTVAVVHNLTDANGMGEVTYQWYANQVPIDQATGFEYPLRPSDLGKQISVKATYTDGLGNLESTLGSVAGVVQAPCTSIDQPNIFATFTVKTPPFTITAGMVAKVTDVLGNQIIDIQHGGKLDLDNALGSNTVIFQGLSSEQVRAERSGQEVKLIEKTTQETIASIPITASPQILQFTDSSQTLILSGVPKLNGVSVPSDKTAPLLLGIGEVGSALVLHYDQELNPNRLPSQGSFSVKMNEIPLSATDFDIESVSGSELTLRLHPSIPKNSVLTVSYTDPSVGDDPQAIQDINGNDSATFTNVKPVTWYAFHSPLTNTLPVSFILDFVVGQDTLVLDDAVFPALQGDQNLSDNVWFKDSTPSQDANDYLVFDPSTQELAYDADASASGGGVVFAQFVGSTTVSAASVLSWLVV